MLNGSSVKHTETYFQTHTPNLHLPRFGVVFFEAHTGVVPVSLFHLLQTCLLMSAAASLLTEHINNNTAGLPLSPEHNYIIHLAFSGALTHMETWSLGGEARPPALP